MKRLGLVLAIMAMVGLTSAVAFAECPGAASKVPELCAGKHSQGSSEGQPAAGMPGSCHKQMQEGTSETRAGDMGQATGCCKAGDRVMCGQKMDAGCPMMSVAPGCCSQGASGRHSQCSRDAKCDRGGKHCGRNERVCKAGGMRCGGAKIGKAQMGCGQMGCEALKGKRGYATVIL